MEAPMPQAGGPGNKVFGVLEQDQFVFVSIHASSLVLAAAFHELKNRQLLDTRWLHALAAGIGVAMVTALFGSSVAYMLLQVGLAWLILNTVGNSGTAAALILIDSMAVLCYLQAKRLYSGELGVVDFTAPVMISTQKLTSLAFNLHDYQLHRRRRPVAQENQQLMVEHRPSLLQLVSYVFFFHGVIVGPMSFYKHYLHFMEELPPDFKAKGRKRSLVRHLALTLCLAAGMLLLVPHYPATALIDPDRFDRLSHVGKLGMTYFVMMMARIKYYFAWNLGSCIQLTAGYGYDTDKHDWTGIKNVSIAKLELATSPKSYIDAWNTATNAWLRLLAHSRLPTALGLPCTFVLSAMWHGFYPGYYFTFLFAIPFVAAARRMRRILRPRVETAGLLPMYHCVTWVATQVGLAYLVVPFTLLHYNHVLVYYSSMRWSLHTVVLLLLLASFLLPVGRPKRQQEQQKQSAKEE